MNAVKKTWNQLKLKIFFQHFCICFTGYRYRFFGQDAEKAAKILDIIAHPDSVGSGLLGLTASVPTFQGPKNYVRKLVLHGEKVGIVSQTETSAEKKVNSSSNSSSGPFSRDLTEVYTIRYVSNDFLIM